MGCTLAECSLLCSFDALFPKTTWQFFEAGKNKDLEELVRITRLFHDACETLMSVCQREMIDGAYDKTFLWLLDPSFSNRLLPPYLGFSEEESLACRAVYEEHFTSIP